MGESCLMLPKGFKVMQETWRPVMTGAYEVSSHGRVRRAKQCRNSYAVGQLLKPSVGKQGYLDVTLASEGGRYGVHQLVAAAFIGPCPPGKEVNHKDGVKTHNLLSNLEYVTHKENMIHAYRLGLLVPARGEETGSAVLTWAKVRRIRALYGTGKYSYSVLAARYGVSGTIIWKVVTNKTWKVQKGLQ